MKFLNPKKRKTMEECEAAVHQVEISFDEALLIRMALLELRASETGGGVRREELRELAATIYDGIFISKIEDE